jgi:hypothetical protein
MCQKYKRRGCYALGKLAWNNDANRVSIAAKHGIEAIVIAMTAHSNIPGVQKWGCFTLFNLTFNESVAVRIQLEGGLAVLEQNPSNSDAKRALQRIKVGSVTFATATNEDTPLELRDMASWPTLR